MAGRYEAVKPPRFEIEHGPGGERIRVRARRNVLALLFLPFWLAGWTLGGIVVVAELARTGEAFLAIWLCAWAAAEAGAILALAWMLRGAELIGVSGRDLEIAQSLFGWKRGRLYRGGEVRHLSACEAPPFLAQLQFPIPFLTKPRWGALKFSYGGRTIYAAQGLDEAEGRMIAERLLRQTAGGGGKSVTVAAARRTGRRHRAAKEKGHDRFQRRPFPGEAGARAMHRCAVPRTAQPCPGDRATCAFSRRAPGRRRRLAGPQARAHHRRRRRPLLHHRRMGGHGQPRRRPRGDDRDARFVQGHAGGD